MNISIHKSLTAVLTTLITLISSCTESNVARTAEYAVFDTVPYNIETNTAAKTTVVRTFPDSYMFRSEYPEYHAIVRYGMTAIADSGKIHKVSANQLDRISDRIGIYDCKISSIVKDSAIYGWVFVTPQSQAPVQMIVTDSATMILHGTMEFTTPQTDSIRVVYPAIETIAADMQHIIKNIRLNQLSQK